MFQGTRDSFFKKIPAIPKKVIKMGLTIFYKFKA